MGDLVQEYEEEAFKAEALFLGSANFLDELMLDSLLGRDNETIGFISPLTRGDLQNEGLISAFCLWRNESQLAYPTRFVATVDSTKKWLGSLLSGGRRILFKLINPSHELIGHIGLAWNDELNRLELDSVQRGVSNTPGLMTAAVFWIESYAQKEFNSPDIHLRVLSSNECAINFFTRLDYMIESAEPVSLSDKRAGQSDEEQDQLLSMIKNLEGAAQPKSAILTAGPSIGYRERYYVADAVKNGWNLSHSKYLWRLQESFAEFVGSKHALATSSCTGALHLAFSALGIGPGDEVIVPAVTWVATASAVAYTGAKPIFVDVDRGNWTLDPLKVEAKLTPATKAIVAVHLYGFLADVSELRRIADTNGIFLVEDAAPAIGATLAGRKAGTFGHFGCFSFQGAKLLVSGEGGMLVTDSTDLYSRAIKLQEHGRKPGTFWIEELGYKYKMSNITAALALGQLERAIPQIVKKRKIAQWYREFLKDIEGLEFQEELPNSFGIHWMTSIKLTGVHASKRDSLTTFLKSKGVDTRPTFPNISKFTFWGTQPQVFSAADSIADDGINLPSGVSLTKSDVDFVASSIRAYLNA